MGINLIFVKINSMKLIFPILLLTTTLLSAQTWQGNWASSFGPIQFNEKRVGVHSAVLVFANYAKHGSLIGVSVAGELHGAFFDAKTQKGGEFVFIQDQESQTFTGRWKFFDKSKKLIWNGTKKNNIAAESLQFVDRFRTTEGRWMSNFGPLDFVQNGVFIEAKYSDKGKIYAVYNQASNIVFGLFTNKQRFGLLQFDLNDEKDSFEGLWSWNLQSWAEQKWTGTKDK